MLLGFFLFCFVFPIGSVSTHLTCRTAEAAACNRRARTFYAFVVVVVVYPSHYADPHSRNLESKIELKPMRHFRTKSFIISIKFDLFYTLYKTGFVKISSF